MNRYQQELAEMDRVRRLRLRAIALLISVTCIVAACWSAGLSPRIVWHAMVVQIGENAPSETDSPSQVQSLHAVEQRAESSPSKPVDLLAATAASVSDTPQRLHLVATMPGRNPAEGTAEIGTDPRAPQTYAAGAILLNGAQLSEIYPNYVVLRRGEEIYRLDLRGDESDARASELAYVGGPSEAVEAASTEDRLSTILRMSPVFENELLVGLQLYPGTRSSAFYQFGLQSGDIVVAVDGSPVFDAAAATQLFEPLVNGAVMTLGVRRSAQIQTISLDGSIVTRTFADADAYASQTPPSLPSG